MIARIFEKKAVAEISVISLPHNRMYMHLDTVFTLIKSNESVVFEPLICQKGKSKVKHFVKSIGKFSEYECLKDFVIW